MDNNILELNNIYYKYKTIDEGIDLPESISKQQNAVNGVSFNIRKGQFVAILGRNGSGKSTLAKHMNALIIPDFGDVIANSFNTRDENNVWNIRKSVGLVFQNPDNQIVGTTVEEDVAFGLENLGVPSKKIRKKVDNALYDVGLEGFQKREPHMLSGGQKQRVAIAGILAMKPGCIVLDESTAMLDPIGREEVISIIKKINIEENIAALLITHHMDEAVKADRVIIVDEGRIISDGTPKEVFKNIKKIKNAGLSVPQVTQLFNDLREKGAGLPDDVIDEEEAFDILKEKIEQKRADYKDAAVNRKTEVLVEEPIGSSIRNSGYGFLKVKEDIGIKVKNLSFSYMKGTPYEKKALNNINIEIANGEIIGLIGHTGSGKSTLIQHFNGLLEADEGNVIVDGIDISKKNLRELRKKVGLVFQYPEHQLFEETVYKDIAFGPLKSGINKEKISEIVYGSLKKVGLDKEIENKSPFELSGGQKRRVALAGVLAMEPEILILDEPTAGLDPNGKEEIFDYIVRNHNERNMITIIVSHSMEDIASIASRIIVLDSGEVIKDGTPKEVFHDEKGLRDTGLSVPQITTLMKKIKNINTEVDEDIFTVSEAVEQIYPLIQD